MEMLSLMAKEAAKKQTEEANIEEMGRDRGSKYRGRALITVGNTAAQRQKQQRQRHSRYSENRYLSWRIYIKFRDSPKLADIYIYIYVP